VEARQFRIVVRDSGPGIKAEVLDRIFNPFFTTKDRGTGLGLAIVHRIVEAHEGTIMATNVAGGGAQFEIRI
jgi:signal transduction histidine kinase